MKIVVLEGGPSRHASSTCWRREFIERRQSRSYGGDYRRRPCRPASCTAASVADTKVHAYKDDMEKFRGQILDADMMVFVTPLYYYGVAQLKMLVDRFLRHQQQYHPCSTRNPLCSPPHGMRTAGRSRRWGPLQDAGAAVSSDGRPVVLGRAAARRP